MTEPIPETGTLLADLLALPAERRLAHLRTVGDPEVLLLALGEEVDQLATAEVGRAVLASEVIVAIADELGSALARADARGVRAFALANGGHPEDALAACEEAVTIAEAAGLLVVAARARLTSLYPLGDLGRYDEAIAAGELARAALVAAAEWNLAARADLNLGATYDRRDDPAMALVHYDRARATPTIDPITIAKIEMNRGIALASLDDYVAAEMAFRTAVSSCEAEGQTWLAALAEGNLAYLATRQGRLELALHHFERGRRYLEQDESPDHLARLLADQADAFANLGLPDEARRGYDRALPKMERHGQPAEAAHARAGLGRALLRLGRHEEAESQLAQAAAAFDTLAMSGARAGVDLARAQAAAAGDRPDEARRLLAAALEVVREGSVEGVAGRHQLARLALAADDLATADAELARALPAAEALDLAPMLADLLLSRGQMRQAQGRPDEALADLRAALERVERVRGTLQAERFRAAFLDNRLAVYETFVVALLARDDAASVDEAFAAVEQAKGRALLDLVSGALDLAAAAEREADDPAEAALLADLARLRNELNWLYSRLGEPAEGERAIGDGPTPQQAIHLREQEFDALQDRIAVARGVAGLYAPPLDLAGALRLVPAGTALVEYFVADDELIAFVLRDGAVRVARSLATSAELAERVRRLHFQIGRALQGGDRTAEGHRAARLLSDVRRELGALDALLLAPLRDAIAGADRLTIVPHGVLHTLPFHALWDGERYLIERHEVVYAPSASVLAHLTTPDGTPPTANDALVVGVPDAAAPRIGEEAAHVARTLGSDRLLLGDEATVARVTAAARDADIVHLACHGRFAPESPLGSGIKLADGWITARDIYSLKLRASLVTLSGCETGRAVIGGGDELVGLIRGFFAAGASSLLLSLWIVNDESTAELMTAFYDAWRGGASKPAALRAAQRALLARRPHPAFWAPFVLGGNP